MELTAMNRARLAKYEAATNPYLVGLALAFLGVYAVPILWTSMPRGIGVAFDAGNLVIWAAFVVDLGIRSYLSGRPLHYLLRHPVDVLLVVVPMLRILRVLRVFTAANYLVTRGGAFAVGRTIASAVVATVMLMFVAALAMLDAERAQPGANIADFGDSLWWAAATVTTVGYGDHTPVTALGRGVAFALMVVGVSMLGVITASVAAWFVERTKKEEDEVLAEIRQQRRELAELRALVVSLKDTAA